MKIIKSAGNENIKLFDSIKTEKGRRQHHLFLVEGEKMISEALDAGQIPALLLADTSFEGEVLGKIKGIGAEIMIAEANILKKASDAVTPQGIIAAFPLPDNKIIESSPLVILDGVQDPGNCGTIWRTCEAAGFMGIVFGARSAGAFSPKVIRATMGAAFRIPAYSCEDTAGYVKKLVSNGYEVLASDICGSDFYARSKISGRYALVVGSEAGGISPEVLASATKRYKLPMSGKTQSLNAAIAAGIMMYDLFIRG